ncbi:Ectonucleoside triphosphate diphosphohydrolase 8 [Microtus ochrogaster]|uniref:Ectonucleoside triphosphate diphosphohydrolase 8 n=1 Tax=Microtus ochrogaster TaxID=79684 RepID=A0A8J6KQ48_MICOH|nr:Ectonucleoside triphosphate diphosphohydrolase 8 [Microtus ochrogaster]
MGLSRKERVFIVLLGIAAASGLTMLLLILVKATNVFLPADTKFGIVFDAGSSHTSLFVYQWPANKEKDTGVVSQTLACQIEGYCVSGPGISSYASDPTQAGESLKSCLEEALALIPRTQHQETPTFLGATAGMRLLSWHQQLPTAKRLFCGQYSSGLWTLPEDRMLVGALDLGGASTQISFVPQGPILNQSSQVTFRLYGANYSIYTHSYLCFGRDQVLIRLLAELAQNSSEPRVQHPCYHNGYQATLSLAPVYESPCVHTTDSLNFTQNLTVEGTGNPRDCVAALQNLFNFSSCKDQDCAFNGVYQPPVYGQFYAFSNFYYTFHFLNLTSRQPLNIVNDTVWKFCQTPWKLVGDLTLDAALAPSPYHTVVKQGLWGLTGFSWTEIHGKAMFRYQDWGGKCRGRVEASYPGQERWLRDYCASGLYILVLLLEGYKFSEETWPNIQFQKQAGGMDIGWTLGYMLNLTGMIPAEAPTQWRAQSYSIWTAGVVFAVLTLVAILGAAAVQLFWTQD